MISLFVIGLNHESATVDLRERVTFAPETMVPTLQRLVNETIVNEAAILSTCNRTELYISSGVSNVSDIGDITLNSVDDTTIQSFDHANSSDISSDVLVWLAQYHGLDAKQLSECCYIHQNDTAIVHMMRVACGLDSMVLGEPQILGQMKSSYAVAQEAEVLGSELHSIFQKVFSVAKRVRTETAIGRNPVSVAYAAVHLAQRIFSDLKQDTALLIGAGETIDLVARHLKEQGIASLIFANRTLERAQLLASEFSAQAILLSDIPEYLNKADIVISSTASQLPILGKGAVESALKQRRHKPMFMVDIAVPRDIEPEVAELDDVYLYTVDDLRGVIDENKQSRAAAAEEAHLIVEQSAADYSRTRRSRYSVAAIKSYRARAEQLRDEALQKAMRDLNNGMPADKVLQQMANNLTNKLLHTPTQQLKQMSEDGPEELIELSQRLLGFTENDLSDAVLEEAAPRQKKIQQVVEVLVGSKSKQHKKK
ncbi:MAG: glutamyl-tRNA reductase [Cellvibrionaceae bacterium]|jgi:glutamyl-tRNA reductase